MSGQWMLGFAEISSPAFAAHLVTDAIGEAICWARERRDSYGAGDYGRLVLAWSDVVDGCVTDSAFMDLLVEKLADEFAVTWPA